MYTKYIAPLALVLGSAHAAVNMTIFTEANCAGSQQEATVNNDSCDTSIPGTASFIINQVSGLGEGASEGVLTFYADGSACIGSSVYQTDVGDTYPTGCQDTNGGAGAVGLEVGASP